MSLLSRLLGIDNAIEQTVKKTISESYDWLPGVPAAGLMDFSSYRPDADGFLPYNFYRKRTNRGDNPEAYLHDEGLTEIRKTSRQLCVSNEYARNGLNNRRNYIVGTGFKTTATMVDDEAADDALAKQVNEWLQRYATLTERCDKEKESVYRGERDGDVFFRLYKDDVLDFKFIEPEYIGNWDGETPFGIKTDPKDITKPTAYLVKYAEEDKHETVPAEDIIHVKLNSDSGIKRGLPYLYPVFSILRKIESVNENMATNVAIMSAIAMIKKKAFNTSAAIDTQNSGEGDIRTTPIMSSGAKDYRAYRPGTIIDASIDTEYEFPANGVNLGGVVSVKESLLQTAAAGMGVPEYMLTSDCSNGNLSTTQVGESPMIVGMQAMQHFWGNVFGSGMYVEGAKLGLTWRAIEYAVSRNQLPAQVLTEIKLQCEGPNIEVRDKTQETNRNKVLADDGIISRDHWAAKEGMHKAHVSDDEMQVKKDKELQATQGHELKMAQAKGAGRAVKEEFEEDLHPRDGDGKFTSKG